MAKKKRWIYPRHRVVRDLAYGVLYPYSRIRYGLQVEPFREQGDRAYLILFNHQTAFDQFFVGMSFKGPVYYVASEDLFSNGWVSALIRWVVAPIPIKKQTTDINAVMNCLRVAKEGGTIAIAPEGNRTYSGKTEYMNPAIAGLARKIKLPIVLYRIEGGYGTHPRWSDVIRKGVTKAGVYRVIEPEEYAQMTNEELLAEIQSGLYVDEGVADGIFRSAKRAEYLERAMYVCPDCGLSTFESSGNTIRCKRCGKTVTYGEDKRLTGDAFPFTFVTEWYDYQSAFINQLDVTAMTAEPLYTEEADLYEVILHKNKQLVGKQTELRLYGNRLELTGAVQLSLPFDDLHAVTVLGRNKLNVYTAEHVYQFKGGKRFNALKYVHIFNRYKNIARGEPDDQFLGL